MLSPWPVSIFCILIKKRGGMGGQKDRKFTSYVLNPVSITFFIPFQMSIVFSDAFYRFFFPNFLGLLLRQVCFQMSHVFFLFFPLTFFNLCSLGCNRPSSPEVLLSSESRVTGQKVRAGYFSPACSCYFLKVLVFFWNLLNHTVDLAFKRFFVLFCSPRPPP